MFCSFLVPLSRPLSSYVYAPRMGIMPSRTVRILFPRGLGPGCTEALRVFADARDLRLNVQQCAGTDEFFASLVNWRPHVVLLERSMLQSGPQLVGNSSSCLAPAFPLILFALPADNLIAAQPPHSGDHEIMSADSNENSALQQALTSAFQSVPRSGHWLLSDRSRQRAYHISSSRPPFRRNTSSSFFTCRVCR